MKTPEPAATDGEVDRGDGILAASPAGASDDHLEVSDRSDGGDIFPSSTIIAPRRARGRRINNRGGLSCSSGGGSSLGGVSSFGSSVTGSIRRSAITLDFLQELSGDLNGLELATKGKDWVRSFRDLDPRYQILKFFNDVSLTGVEDFENEGCSANGADRVPQMLRMFIKSGIFSVWRPTSPDAIRKMITGEGTGKGLDIKGKSAKCGAFSGYVPFLQIHDNEHKKAVGPMRADHRVRIFYPNKSSRDNAFDVASMLGASMVNAANLAEEAIAREEKKRARRRSSMLFMNDMSVSLGDVLRYQMEDPTVYKIDDYAESQGVYGLDLNERLFWESYVVPNDITRPKGSKYETGRPSMPEFQQMNIETLRKPESNPRPVLWHGDCGRVGGEAPEDCNPMCPLGLLIAYEEGDKVVPVVSDFDCFVVGTRNVSYHEPLGTQELSMLSMCVDDIEGILATPEEGKCWTQRWLGVKKKHYQDDRGSAPVEMPKFGYADPRSYKIMTGAVDRLKSNGAVRHGPECFNYGFPQDLDDQFLVISDTFPGVPWRYANPKELVDILSAKIDEGFTFPLNPKWILCDGWKPVYDKLIASDKPNVQDSMNIWYPVEIRMRIDDISTKYPAGFIDHEGDAGDLHHSSGVQTDLAELELRRYKVRLEAKEKIRNALSKQGIVKRLRESAVDLRRDSLKALNEESDLTPEPAAANVDTDCNDRILLAATPVASLAAAFDDIRASGGSDGGEIFSSSAIISPHWARVLARGRANSQLKKEVNHLAKSEDGSVSNTQHDSEGTVGQFQDSKTRGSVTQQEQTSDEEQASSADRRKMGRRMTQNFNKFLPGAKRKDANRNRTGRISGIRSSLSSKLHAISFRKF